MQKLVATSLASLMFAGTLTNPIVAEAESGTTTPIKHLVVIFQEMSHSITTSAPIQRPSILLDSRGLSLSPERPR
jgi:hypothetical protein